MFKVEVIADDSGKFCGNGLTFASVSEAIKYAEDLYRRWTLVRTWRIVCVDKDQLVNSPVVCGKEQVEAERADERRAAREEDRRRRYGNYNNRNIAV